MSKKQLSDLSFESISRIFNLLSPTQSHEPATKGYVDSILAYNNISQIMYVRKDGNDTTGDGSFTKPFLTIHKANTTITDATQFKKYIIDVGAGVYVETQLALKKYIFIHGKGRDVSRIDLTGHASGGLKLDASISGTVGTFVLKGLHIGGSTGTYFDLTDKGGGTSILVIDDCYLLSLSSLCPDDSQVIIRNSEIYGSCSLSNTSLLAYNSVFDDLAIGLSSALGTFNYLYNITVGSTFNLPTTLTSFMVTYIRASSIGYFNATQSGGSTNYLYHDGCSFMKDNTTIGAGVTVEFLSDAKYLGYTPTTSGNWLTQPIDVKGALDKLATDKMFKEPVYQNIYVFHSYTGTIENGSYSHPFKTLQSAINFAFTMGANSHIWLMSRGFTENITINNYNANLTIQGFGAIDNNSTNMTGSITISGTSTRIRLINFQISAPSGPDVIYDGCDGRCYMVNMQLNGATGGVEFRNVWKRWYEFTDCSINGSGLNIIGSPTTSPLISTFRLRGAGNIVLNTSASLQLFDSANFGGITHTNGNLIIDGGRGITGAFNSTANTPNVFRMYNFNMINASTQLFIPINKTGTAPYVLSGVLRDETVDVLTGVRTYQGLTAVDQRYVPLTPSDWITSPSSVYEALNSLGQHKLRETFETVNKNLKASNATSLNYTGNRLDSVVYANGITKTLNYTGNDLTSIVLSGSTPSGISLTKTLVYGSGKLTSFSYS